MWTRVFDCKQEGEVKGHLYKIEFHNTKAYEYVHVFEGSVTYTVLFNTLKDAKFYCKDNNLRCYKVKEKS